MEEQDIDLKYFKEAKKCEDENKTIIEQTLELKLCISSILKADESIIVLLSNSIVRLLREKDNEEKEAENIINIVKAIKKHY